MTDVVDRALTLWTAEPLPEPEALEAFRTVYTDPVRVNGAVSPLQPLVDRMLHGAFEGLHHELFERVDTPGRSSSMQAL